MRVSVVGLGYVGTVVAAVLADLGHDVWAIDVDTQRVRGLEDGTIKLSEPGINPLIERSIRSSRLHFADHFRAGSLGEVVLFCVGTPSDTDGKADLRHLRQAFDSALDALAAVPSHAGPRSSQESLFLVLSTTPPGGLRQLFDSCLERAQATSVKLAYMPEFLREGSALEDFRDPPLSVVGADDVQAAVYVVNRLFPQRGIDCYGTDLESAQCLKYACNAWHAVKVAFGNEIGRMSAGLGGDGQLVMGLLSSDTRLNISRRYLTPGAPYGGSCLPKDMAAIRVASRQVGVALPLLESLPESNEEHSRFLLNAILAGNHRRVLILGVAFKSGTDDVRESPFARLASSLRASGVRVQIFDPLVNSAVMDEATWGVLRGRYPEVVGALQETPSASGFEPDVIVLGHDVLAELGHELAVACSARLLSFPALMKAPQSPGALAAMPVP